MTDTSKPIIVVGDGWAALGAVGFLAAASRTVQWVTGTGGRLTAPLPVLEVGPGLGVWAELASRLGVEAGEVQIGSYLREFRNKSFREMPWTKVKSSDARPESRDAELWSPERRFAGAFEARFGMDLNELESEIRARVAAMDNVKRIEGVPVEGVRAEDGRVTALLLGSGEELPCDQIYFADRWSRLTAMSGLPKPLSFVRNREPMGALQATFTHTVPVGAAVAEGFCCVMHREAGEEFERRVYGYFSKDGTQSHWSLFLAGEEVEDNHQIAKKFRRLKQTLDRMFTGPEWLPEGSESFMANVKNEQVRFEEAIVFGGGESIDSAVLLGKGATRLDGISFLTDGYGPSNAFHQIFLTLGDELQIPLVPVSEWLPEDSAQCASVRPTAEASAEATL